jgi:hypothetical protein
MTEPYALTHEPIKALERAIRADGYIGTLDRRFGGQGQLTPS